MSPPLIAYSNAVTDGTATITASTEAAGFPKESALSWWPHKRWKATSAPAWIIAEWSSARSAKGFGLHIVTGSSATIAIEYSTVGTAGPWAVVNAGFAAAGRGTFLIVLPAAVNVRAVRWSFSVDLPEVAVLFAGSVTEMPRGPAIGFAPPLASLMARQLTAQNRSGDPIGSSIEYEEADINMSFPSLETAFVQGSEWLAFRRLANRGQPFILDWNPTVDPAGTVLMHSAEVSAPDYDEHGHHEVSVSGKARA